MELSRDKIKEIINDDWLLMDDCEGNKNCDVVKELARIALASLEAEPIGFAFADDVDLMRKKNKIGGMLTVRHHGELALFTAPPAPVSMKDHQIRELVNELRDIAVEYHGTQQLRERIARIIRAAMLQGAEPVSNRDELPDGWVACSERMPREVLAALQNITRLRRNLNDFCGDKSVIAKCLIEAEEALLNAVNRHSTMLAEAPQQEAKNV